LTHDPSTGTPRPPSSHLDMGPGDGYASCRLVGNADPNEVINEGAGDYLYVLTVASIREAGMDVFETPESGGPGHCDITGVKTIRRRAKQRLMAEALWVRGHSPPRAPPVISKCPEISSRWADYEIRRNIGLTPTRWLLIWSSEIASL